MKKIIISAYNINGGGGRVLLLELLNNLSSANSYLIFIDSRLILEDSYKKKNITFFRIHPKISSRLIAEFKIFSFSRTADRIICFGNLPPLFGTKIQTFIFVQNRYLVDPKNLFRFGTPKIILRTLIEKIWLQLGNRKRYFYLVQTPTMKTLLKRTLGKVSLIYKIRFYPKIEITGNEKIEHFNRYIYVASGEPHKNHKNLVNAWKDLKVKNLNPELLLILNSIIYSKLHNWINASVKRYNLNIKIIDKLSYPQVINEYRRSKALIFPSKFETVGLPLIEANKLNLPVIASNLDFVRDVIIPNETFDPNSANSIAQALIRFENKNSNSEK